MLQIREKVRGRKGINCELTLTALDKKMQQILARYRKVL